VARGNVLVNFDDPIGDVFADLLVPVRAWEIAGRLGPRNRREKRQEVVSAGAAYGNLIIGKGIPHHARLCGHESRAGINGSAQSVKAGLIFVLATRLELGPEETRKIAVQQRFNRVSIPAAKNSSS